MAFGWARPASKRTRSSPDAWWIFSSLLEGSVLVCNTACRMAHDAVPVRKRWRHFRASSALKRGWRVLAKVEDWSPTLAGVLLSRHWRQRRRRRREGRRKWHAPWRRVPTELFRVSVNASDAVDDDDDDTDKLSPASYPSSPRERSRVLRAQRERSAVLLSASRELLRIEIRCVKRADADAVSARIAHALRRRRLAPLLEPRTASPDLTFGSDGLLVVRATASYESVAAAQSAAPLPPRAWIYFHVEWQACEHKDESDDDDQLQLRELYCGLTPLGCRLGSSGSVALSSLGGLLINTTWSNVDDSDDDCLDPCMRHSLFGPGDTLGLLAYHEANGECRVFFAVNGLCVANACLTQSRRMLLYPILAFRSKHVSARCAFSAAHLSNQAISRLGSFVSSQALQPALEAFPPIYAIDGTRIRYTCSTSERPSLSSFCADSTEPGVAAAERL